MSLQVRLRHPLGERWFDLPERGVDQPIVVGRAGTADLQVPSATVGQDHCVLFVHEGRWIVQEVAGGSRGTYVNGSKVDGAAFLHVGDVVTLGPDAAAPAMEIDPSGAAEGRAAQPAVGELPAETAAPSDPSPAYAAPYVPPQPVAPPSYPHTYPTYPGPYPGAYPVPTSAAPASWPQQAAPAAEGSIADWPADATPPHYSTRRRRRTSDGSSGVVIGMLLTLFVTAGAAYWIYRHFGDRTALVVAPPPATQSSPAPPVARPPADHSTGAPPNIFDAGQPRKTPAASPGSTTRSAASAGAPAPNSPGGAPGDMGSGVEPTDMADAGMPPVDSALPENPPDAAPMASDDPAWKQVETARHLKDEAKAILQFDDYARTHPGTSGEKIQQYTEQMLDRIWLERVENLCEQREELNRKLAEVDRELAEETDAAHKNRVLTPLRQQYVSRLKNIEEELTQNMKYDGKSTPNLLDDAEVEKLRQARDPQYYASWKNRVLSHIRRTHGELPWVAATSR